ncbi:MAG: hypothetical protein Kow0069_29860 [Promethearchaeota archaeon]
MKYVTSSIPQIVKTVVVLFFLSFGVLVAGVLHFQQLDGVTIFVTGLVCEVIGVVVVAILAPRGYFFSAAPEGGTEARRKAEK